MLTVEVVVVDSESRMVVDQNGVVGSVVMMGAGSVR